MGQIIYQGLKVHSVTTVENPICFVLGMPPCEKSAVFLNIVQKAFDPPPFYLNICPILQGVFFKRVFAGGVF